jgi:bifunctional DNA-binding transcriptional regulator/antitoxin component of YhaV-PrlF toxin-antitoxin module
MNEYPKFVTTCEEDEDGNLILPFPEELLDAMGWGEGTTLDLDVIGDRLIIREVVAIDNEEDGRVAV